MEDTGETYRQSEHRKARESCRATMTRLILAELERKKGLEASTPTDEDVRWFLRIAAWPSADAPLRRPGNADTEFRRSMVVKFLTDRLIGRTAWAARGEILRRGGRVFGYRSQPDLLTADDRHELGWLTGLGFDVGVTPLDPSGEAGSACRIHIEMSESAASDAEYVETILRAQGVPMC